MAETLPPLTTRDLKTYLENPTFSVYVYIGAETDKGWDCAQIIYGLLTRFRIYLVEDISLIKDWVGTKRPRGVVFGWGPNPVRLLNKSEAEDLRTVLIAITDARSS